MKYGKSFKFCQNSELRIVFFFNVLLFKGTKQKQNEKHNATRAQFCATRAQFEKVVHFAQIHQQDHLLFFERDHFFVKRHQTCRNDNVSIRVTFF
jgi:hypothetical protein